MHYRLYLMDFEGHIRHAINLECDDDAHAIRLVQARSENIPMELWCGARVVRKFSVKAQNAGG